MAEPEQIPRLRNMAHQICDLPRLIVARRLPNGTAEAGETEAFCNILEGFLFHP